MSSSLSNVVCRHFSLDEIKDATNNFDVSNVLGHGGEGVVYLGHIAAGKDGENFAVAVKRLNPNSIEFEKEIEIVSKFQHSNLVCLLGYCNEFGQKILVYEYMQRGSLSDYVKKKISICLSWKQRLKICLGVARGLQYLHTATDELPKGIIHRDMKPANILLDKNWVAKVSDFGMFKLSHADQTNSTMLTGLKGTSGYYAPEYIRYARITRKIDVYAFGVVLFEVLCGKKPWDREEDESYYIRDDEDFGVWAQKNVDVEINGEIPGDSLKIFTDIIGRSLQRDPGDRLTMDEVVLDLERALKCHEDHEGIRPKALRICVDCNAEVGQGRFVNCIQGVWHPECLHCHACSLPISHDKLYPSENHLFHISCYMEGHRPTCDVCKNFISINAADIEYGLHRFWLQKYCPSHEHDGTPRCYSCERMEPRDAKYLLLDDGRKLCPECLDSVIMDTHECQPLYLEILEFFDGMNMKIEQQFPLLLVESRVLNKGMEEERYLGQYHQEVQGRYLYKEQTEEQTVSTISRSEPNTPIRQSKIAAIHIMCSLPRLMTGSIIAKMMIRAWLRIKGYTKLPPDVKRGICLVVAHMWLDSEIQAGSGTSVASTPSSSSSSSAAPVSSKKGNLSQFEKQLGEFLKDNIESDEAYGNVFKEGKKAVLKHGLKTTIDHILLTGTFPCE